MLPDSDKLTDYDLACGVAVAALLAALALGGWLLYEIWRLPCCPPR